MIFIAACCSPKAPEQRRCNCFNTPNDDSDVQTALKYYVRLLTEDKIETSKVMGDFHAGAGFGVPRSESCSEKGPLPRTT